MLIIRIEQTLIPNTLEGKAFADEYEERLRRQHVFRWREEDTTYITLKAVFTFSIKETENCIKMLERWNHEQLYDCDIQRNWR